MLCDLPVSARESSYLHAWESLPPYGSSWNACYHNLQAQAEEQIKQLQAENVQLKQAASKRGQALAQSKQFVNTYLQRSSALSNQLQNGASTNDDETVAKSAK